MLKLNITDELYNYVLKFGIRKNDTLQKIHEYNQTLATGRMQSAPEQVQFMSLMAKLIQATKYLALIKIKIIKYSCHLVKNYFNFYPYIFCFYFIKNFLFLKIFQSIYITYLTIIQYHHFCIFNLLILSMAHL